MGHRIRRLSTFLHVPHMSPSQEAAKPFKPSQNWLTIQKTLQQDPTSKKRKRPVPKTPSSSRNFSSTVRPPPKLTSYNPWQPQNSQRQKGNPALILQPQSSSKISAVGKYVAIDCEMVEVKESSQPKNALARVSIVNYYGYPLLDMYVTPKGRVTDFRTSVSGIRPSNILHNPNAISFEEAQAKAQDLLKNRILVGHSMLQDLMVLKIDHPRQDRRDTSLYPPFRNKHNAGNSPALRKLALAELGVAIQFGEHDSVEDAQAAMALFRSVHHAFETFSQRVNSGQQVEEEVQTEVVVQAEEVVEQESEVTHAALKMVSAVTVVEESTQVAETIPEPLSAETERKIKIVSKRRKFT